MKVILDSEGYVKCWSITDDVIIGEDEIVVDAPESIDYASMKSYRLVNNVLVKDENRFLTASKKNRPTQLDRIEAQIAYTAMMTDTLLEG